MNSNIKNYIAIARPDHWVKHVFILPGILLAMVVHDVGLIKVLPALLIGLPSAFFIASGNYVINEWLDRSFDRFHPTKKNRPAAAGLLTVQWVYLEYVALITMGIGLAYQVSPVFFVAAVCFAISGFIYNVPPLRLKEIVYIDVLTESLNNPIRLTMGWGIVSYHALPPASLLILFWFSGAFLMTVKRFAEYRYIVKQGKLNALKEYRESFKFYTEDTLLILSFLYAILSSFFIASFLIKYRIEFLFSFPFIAMLFTYYLAIGLREGSIAQNPEKLHKDKGLLLIVFLTVFSLVLFSFWDVPLARWILESHPGVIFLGDPIP